VTLFLLHLLAIASGLSAVAGCLAFLHAAGLVLLPARWHDALADGAVPLLTGILGYILAAWFGIKAGVPLTPIALGFAAAAALLAAVRRRVLVADLRRQAMSVDVRFHVALFGAGYVLAYLFRMPPASPDYLPIASLGNGDLYSYLVYAKHLLRLGPSPVADVSAHSFAYLQTPGVFSLLGTVSLLWGGEPIRAAMPVLFAGAALSAVAAASIARRAFGLSTGPAVLVGVAVLSGAFFRFVQGHFFLSSLLGLPVLLSLLDTTAEAACGEPPPFARAAFVFFVHDAVLLFIYPALLPVALFLQGAALLFSALAPPRGVAKPARTAAAAAAALAALGLLAAPHLVWIATMLRTISRTGVYGWALDIISPLVLVGFPAHETSTQVGSPAARVACLAAAFIMAAGAGVAALLRRAPWAPSRVARAFAGMAGAAFLAYAGYFVLVGPSYQQWKLASYTALPLSFVFVAAFLRLAAATRWPIGPAVVALVAVGGNAAVHLAADVQPPPPRANLRNLSRLNDLRFKDFSFEAPGMREAMLVSYFVPSKRLHVSLEDFPLSEPVMLEEVSPARPLLLLNFGCEGVGHGDVLPIERVGCLAYRPPTLSADTRYPFNRSFLFIQPVGMGRREAWGRVSVRRTVVLGLVADPRRVDVARSATWLRLLLQPAAQSGIARPILRFSWGADRRAEVQLGEPGWLSLPLRVGDWSVGWLSRLTLRLDLPDGPEGAVLPAVEFFELSVGTTPLGRSVIPLP
jgi:hypothetical protein